MKKEIILMAVLFFVSVFPYEGVAQQKAQIADPVFTFEPVPEGVHVSHTFIVKNTGDSVLTIIKVTPP
ncbi:MAG: hypothetical protein A3J80_06325 [Desulfobacula sp. RIFOXYB2_FULL_45_6]|nr:MAG: hypothetical protein A3J80_06325 [Desulfobacula sp. RIFOXYB2_FULL_45_6]